MSFFLHVVVPVVLVLVVGLILWKFVPEDWIAITVSVAALVASVSVTLYATGASAKAAAELSSRDQKLSTYTEFLAATRSAFNVLPDIQGLYVLNDAGMPGPVSGQWGEAPPESVVTAVSTAAADQEVKYWLINAYDDGGEAHRTAWSLYTYVFCLNRMLEYWDYNMSVDQSDGDKRVAQYTALDGIQRLTEYVPNLPQNEPIDCAADMPASNQDALYGGDQQAKSKDRAPARVISRLEAEIRRIAGVPAVPK